MEYQALFKELVQVTYFRETAINLPFRDRTNDTPSACFMDVFRIWRFLDWRLVTKSQKQHTQMAVLCHTLSFWGDFLGDFLGESSTLQSQSSAPSSNASTSTFSAEKTLDGHTLSFWGDFLGDFWGESSTFQSQSSAPSSNASTSISSTEKTLDGDGREGFAFFFTGVTGV